MRYSSRCLMPMVVCMLLSLLFSACKGQSSRPASGTVSTGVRNTAPVGGGCDGCELMFIGMPSSINAVDTSPGWKEKGQQLMIAGKAVKADGITPAPGVIIYYWQTDNNGYYSPRPGLDERVKRHGHIRGWMKSDSDGNFSLYTVRPAPYPGEDMPAHIHLSIKEPDISNEYYVDELVFDDDAYLTGEKRSRLENRGGSGILKTRLESGRQAASYKLVLGFNIPGYPK
jgi:protocatechuate 3,4-dioxygenase beta subunit